ncbi:copper amine oxidase N-terminal domain-containing protein [Saccharibacillus sacchari]|uniref:copper amine oxidase N-terminal domain-containing protein n=1 Tax=Saccharibacillus sacchari TaxID=456493 RepID=UPI0004B664CA|nr:copper amine oxidase N-terminal domain-containing protein [Saccharibacillus sacchari]
MGGKVWSILGKVSLIAGIVLSIQPLAKTEAATTFSAAELAKLPIHVLVDAHRVNFPDVQPVIKNETTMIPLRFVTQSLGGKLSLQGKNITIVKDKKVVKLTIGSNTATVNGKTLKLNVSSIAQDGRTLVPLRFVSEGLGESVNWDSASKFVWIGSREVPKIEDETELESLNTYESFLKLNLSNFNGYGKPLTQARVITESDFPLNVGNQTIYRMDIVKNTLGEEYIRTISDSKSIIGMSYFLYEQGQPEKIRSEIVGLRDKSDSNKSLRISYIAIVDRADRISLGLDNYDDMKIRNIDYLSFSLGRNDLVLMKNKFK